MIHFHFQCLGNHEFDLGVEGLVPFLDNVTFPVLSANTDVSREPRLNKVQKRIVLTKGGEQIGIIGYLTTETEFISTPGKFVFV